MPQTEMNKATRKKKTVALPHTSQMPSRSTLDLQHIVYYLVESKKGFVYEKHLIRSRPLIFLYTVSGFPLPLEHHFKLEVAECLYLRKMREPNVKHLQALWDDLSRFDSAAHCIPISPAVFHRSSSGASWKDLTRWVMRDSDAGIDPCNITQET